MGPPVTPEDDSLGWSPFCGAGITQPATVAPTSERSGSSQDEPLRHLRRHSRAARVSPKRRQRPRSPNLRGAARERSSGGCSTDAASSLDARNGKPRSVASADDHSALPDQDARQCRAQHHPPAVTAAAVHSSTGSPTATTDLERPHEALGQRRTAAADTSSAGCHAGSRRGPLQDADHQLRRVQSAGEIERRGRQISSARPSRRAGRHRRARERGSGSAPLSPRHRTDRSQLQLRSGRVAVDPRRDAPPAARDRKVVLRATPSGRC